MRLWAFGAESRSGAAHPRYVWPREIVYALALAVRV
jgi:hypothetical protein